MITYAGIGSRSTPQEFLQKMYIVGRFMAIEGGMLRSGGAQGADTAFELGCDEMKGLKQIFLPWKNFNNNPSPYYGTNLAAREIAKKYHPKWEYLLPSTRDLMARNSYQILGLDLKSPVDFVCCWTRNGDIDGGTGQALRIADDLKIPVLNFGSMPLKEIDKRIMEIVYG